MVISHSYVSLPEGSRDDSPSIMVSIIRHGEKMNEMFGLLLAYCSVFSGPPGFIGNVATPIGMNLPRFLTCSIHGL